MTRLVAYLALALAALSLVVGLHSPGRVLGSSGPVSIPVQFITGGDAGETIQKIDGSARFAPPPFVVGMIDDPHQAAQTLAGDVTGKTDAAIVRQLTGIDAGVTVIATEVGFGGAFAPLVVTRERTCTGSACTMTLPIPNNVVGFADVIVAVRQGDGGANGGAAQWRCGILNNGGTCKVWSACTATTAYASTDAGGAWAPSVAVSSCVITVTAAAVAGLDNASTLQVAVAR